jgi:hypothetical protein
VVSDNVIRYGAIHVIESLPAETYRSGEHLFRSLLEPTSRAKGYPAVTYSAPDDRVELIQCLSAIADQVERQPYRPLLHLEAHGEPNGLQVASGELVAWEDLRATLTRINRATGVHLSIVLSMCQGWAMTRLLRPDQPAPVFALIGPIVDVSADELYNAYDAFYQSSIYSEGRQSVLRALNGHRPPADWRFRVEFASEVFSESFARYLAVDCTPEALRARENEVVADLVRRRKLDLFGSAEARLYARRLLTDQRSFFEYAKAEFFLCDEFPVNRARFPFTFEECVGLAAPPNADDSAAV